MPKKVDNFVKILEIKDLDLFKLESFFKRLNQNERYKKHMWACWWEVGLM